MDADIHFGDLEETAPQQHLRPDRNKHFAVVAYESPEDGDLPVFIDMDVLRDMEVHAASDTSVELGGVLLGGQYEDEHGESFVLITDSLRAEHYENSKGSFKFTHDTWSHISRQREEFPADLQMVGWYHTHPDWGVFLSGMDMFICDNFFNKPLDVAYVIDPCRLDRAFFQWTGNASQRVRRIGGFYAVSSRFRQQELQWYVSQLEGKVQMSDPRYASQFGPMPPPVVNISEQRSSWHGVAIMGMLTMQFLFLALLAWKMLDLEKKDQERPSDYRVAVQRELVNEFLREMPNAPKNYLSKLEQDREKLKLSEATTIGLKKQVDSLQEETDRQSKDLKDLKKRHETAKKSRDEYREKSKQKTEEIEALTEKIKKYENGESVTGWRKWLMPAGIVGLVFLLITAAIGATMTMRRQEQEGEDEPEPEVGEAFEPPPEPSADPENPLP